jgi:hypothetical protein
MTPPDAPKIQRVKARLTFYFVDTLLTTPWIG